MEGRSVPFGKYKGQPMSVLFSDKKYYEWLQNQSWFKNNFEPQKDQPTPKHNRLQCAFLDHQKVINFLEGVINPTTIKDIKVVFEHPIGWDVVISYEERTGSYWDEMIEKEEYTHKNIYIELKTMVGDEYPSILRKLVRQKDSMDDNEGLYVLVIDSYNGDVPLDDVKKIFKTQEIIVIDSSFQKKMI
jgi:hypothetical protein